MTELVMNDIVLDPLQKQAVELAADPTQRLVAVSGAAGTGKTTIMRKALDMVRAQGYSVAFAAPTGKAARRITEATGIPAVTIHRLLEYGRPGERDEKTGKAVDITTPKRNRVNPLTYKFIFVDEYAMVNYELHNNLIAALPSGACLRAFGDLHQLPPIENDKGAVHVTNGQTDPKISPFAHLLKNFAGVQLQQVHRQAEGSNVLMAASKVRAGHTPPVNRDLGDFAIKLTDRPIEVLTTYVRTMEENGKSFRAINNQIIVPTKKTWVGTVALNALLRNMLNRSPEQKLELPRYSWDKEKLTIGTGDKVVCTSNTYDMRNFTDRYELWEDGRPVTHSYIPCPETKTMLNGETGVVLAIHPDGSIEVDFGDRICEIPAVYNEYWSKRDTIIDTFPLRDIDLAYALTTHKCQGSEYENVCYVMNKSGFYTHSRQNLYTGLTRASKAAFIITDQRSLIGSLNKVKS